MAILRIEAINKGVWQYHHVPFSLLVAPLFAPLFANCFLVAHHPCCTIEGRHLVVPPWGQPHNIPNPKPQDPLLL
jgi:hypothetical protein